MKVSCILLGGPVQTIRVRGKPYRFEMHHYCGPFTVKKNDDPTANQPEPGDPFWEAVTLWDRQGRKVENGECVWFHEPEPILEHLGGRNYYVLGHKPAVRGT